MTVYLLMHTRDPEGPDDEANVKTIGIYSTEAKAEEAAARARLVPGFRKWPENFSVGPYELDRDHWTEGFGAEE